MAMTGAGELHHRCSVPEAFSEDEGLCGPARGPCSPHSRGACSPLQQPAVVATVSSPLTRVARRVGMHPARLRHRYQIDLCGVVVQLPRTSWWTRAIAALIALLVLIQAVSCGLFFCVAVPPFGHRATYVDVRDIVSDVGPLASQKLPAGAAAAAAAAVLPSHGPSGAAINTPKLIPRIIHQTYRTKRFPRGVRPLVRSWRAVNGDAWEVRFYDDVAAVNFVRREFPEYLEAYLALPKDVERADFFK